MCYFTQYYLLLVFTTIWNNVPTVGYAIYSVKYKVLVHPVQLIVVIASDWIWH